ncbi:MAG: hypothetical protein R2752_13755 [Vicinamibacterales bacterium]
MAELRRLDPTPSGDDTGRDGRVEALLVEGLDRYFAGRFEEAIHIWTRVLFLDRSHARARAYIDRARTAMAERQRRGDELLQASQEMLRQGRTAAARDLLSEAVATTGEDESVSAVRARLERLERAHAASVAAGAARTAPNESVPGWSWPRRRRAALLLILPIVAGMLAIVAVSSPDARDLFGLTERTETLPAEAPPPRLPVLTAADAALVRARTLYTRGRLAEALEALARVGAENPARPTADQLRVEIQQLLLATSRVGTSSQDPGGPPR